jgi:hypothetical protein
MLAVAIQRSAGRLPRRAKIALLAVTNHFDNALGKPPEENKEEIDDESET